MTSKELEAGGVPLSTIGSEKALAAEANGGHQGHSVSEKRKIRVRLWKDCLLLTVAWLSLYMGYNSMAAVQNSLYGSGLGVAALCAEFASMTFGNLFTDSFIIKRLGCKWTVALGMGTYAAYLSANFHPAFYTLVPLAIISGITSAAMWVAQSAYITRLGEEYARQMGVNADNTKSRFIGILYMGYLGSNVVGNAASSLILGSDMLSTGLVDQDAYNPYLPICGASYCNEELDSNIHWLLDHNASLANSTQYHRDPSKSQVWAFCGFCVGAAILGCLLVVFFLDSLPQLGINEKVCIGDQSSFALFTASIRQWKDPNQLLLIPIGIYNGMDNPFWSSEFTKAYVTCAIGIHFIGVVMVCYGVTAPIMSFIAGFAGKERFRTAPFFVAFTAHFCTAISLLFWKPSPDNIVEMFILTGVWGIGTGVWSGQVPAFYSIIFTDNLEAAFSNSRLWDAAGRTMSYGWSYPLCMKYKIYLVSTMVAVGICGLIGIEVRYWAMKRRRKGEDNPAAQNNVETHGNFYSLSSPTTNGSLPSERL